MFRRPERTALGKFPDIWPLVCVTEEEENAHRVYTILQFVRKRYYEIEDLEQLKQDMRRAKGLDNPFMGYNFKFYALRVAAETGIYICLDWYVIYIYFYTRV